MEKLLDSGKSIDKAYAVALGNKAGRDVASVLVIGQVTKQVGALYFEHAEKLLKRFVVVVQPTLMIALGILIAMLIYAIYIPIIQLPEALSRF